MPTQQVKGATKTDPGACAWLEEHVSEDGAIEHLGNAFAMCIGFHTVGNLKHPVYIDSFKLFYADDMGAAKIHETVLRNPLIFQ